MLCSAGAFLVDIIINLVSLSYFSSLQTPEISMIHSLSKVDKL